MIGSGTMGSAAARHFSKTGATVVSIGPDESEVAAEHRSVFASHYDKAGIARHLAPDPGSVAAFDAVHRSLFRDCVRG